MRFLVDTYRWVVLGGFALAIIALVYGALKVGAASADYGAAVLLAGAGVLLVIVMGLGTVATMISIHDRHAELVDELRAIRAEMERR